MKYALLTAHVCNAPVIVISSSTTLKDVLMELSTRNVGNGVQRIDIRRDRVLDDMIRETGKKNFNCNPSNIKVWFIGECGEDYGGLTRESWGLLSKEIKFKLCTGISPNLVFSPNFTKLQVCYHAVL